MSQDISTSSRTRQYCLNQSAFLNKSLYSKDLTDSPEHSIIPAGRHAVLGKEAAPACRVGSLQAEFQQFTHSLFGAAAPDVSHSISFAEQVIQAHHPHLPHINPSSHKFFNCKEELQKRKKKKSSIQKYKAYFNEFSDLKTVYKVYKTLKSVRFKPLMKSICLVYDALFSQHPN